MDIIFQLEKVHDLVNEMLPKGLLAEANPERVLSALINKKRV